MKHTTKKVHRFTLDVETSGTRTSAWHAVLCAFAARAPDGCKFSLHKSKPPTGPSPKIVKAVANWLATGQVGSSSKALACAVLGHVGKNPSHPHDPADLNRCLLLIEQVPEAYAAIGKLATVSDKWLALAEVWEGLAESFLKEAGRDWSKSHNAPRTYARMRRALEGV